MNESSHKLLAVGATGSIGRHVVAVALAEGHAVRVLVRDAGQAALFPARVETVVGELTRLESLTEAVAGVDAIVFTHGSNGRPPGPEAVDYGAVRNVLAALGGREARIALMTTIGATDRKGAHDWKRRGERLLRASGLPYTIVRPSWFDYNAPDQHRLVMLQGDTRLTGTPRDGVIARTSAGRGSGTQPASAGRTAQDLRAPCPDRPGAGRLRCAVRHAGRGCAGRCGCGARQGQHAARQ